ncbi:ABC transporter substrate-binding protein [Bradyrhizobium cajani]|uniref:ABC transporter substrate-binding protein n=1 Tax=Bradyrhizobium cajani TaxID=1928661 RepID=A0A844T8N1_9BRAD|nr:ABC transporter substrate-binding protein [Bradyrhizobium cajani]MCP3370534.1 ABC transporter substrate-binding protein [Bradyrhizobium cajani]MVT75478.1 ABC transporter substrate-binding protein [Bradyrhizobium cajani]
MKLAAALIGMSLLALAGGSAHAEGSDEIRIGQTLPYSGPASGFGAIGRTQEAFFEKINAEGGIGGRKVKFITLDDAYSPPKTVEHTRKLVEQDEVLMMFGSLGTATNSAVQRYLNAKKVPQLFVLSGASKWAEPAKYPWTMPGMAAYESEGVVYAKHILKAKPDAKIAILSQNDDFGRDYVAGFKRALGTRAASMIIAEATYETSAPTISSQLSTLKSSGADVLFGVVLGKFTSQMIKGVAEIGWKPELFFVPTSASSISFLEPAGLDNAVGLISSSNQKDTMDPQWADDPGVKEYFAFMKRYMPNADLANSNYAAGYHYATLLMTVLRACNDDFSRDNIMRQAASLKDVRLPLLLPGMAVSTGTEDYLPFQQLQLRRFNGKSWVQFGDVLDDR